MAIKLMQIVHSLCRAGSETLAKEIAVGLKPSIFQTSLCALDVGGQLEEDLQKYSIPFYVMNRKPGFDKALIWRLYQLFHREQVDIVQTHHLAQLVYSMIGARLVGARLIHVEHASHSLQSTKIQRRLRLLATFCHKVVAVSDVLAEFLHKEIGIPRAKLLTIYNGVNYERFAVSHNAVRSTFGFSSEDPLIGTVSRLEQIKDPLTLLDAFRVVHEAHPCAKLVIVGDGSLRPALEQRTEELKIRNNVVFLGIRSDIPELLSFMDVFVLSSFQEGLPLAILEAMAAGKPVVATAVGSIPQIVRAGITGYLVPPQSPNQLAEALIQVLSDRQMASAMGKAGRALVESQYQLTKTVRDYQKLYESVV